MPDTIGKYQVEEVLGRGAMGVVYKCYDQAIDRHVAIKAIGKSELDPEDLKHVIERFRHEAKAVGRLMHQGIVQIYDYAEDDDIAYIVMELVKGRTLQQYLKAGEEFSPRESGDIIGQILEGIGHAHAQGVVHRDIKPSNILINESGAIKIADFGIARTEASSLTQAGDMLGTLFYMSPEQFLGGEVTAAADVYAIGVIAYELLTGRRPFVGSSAEVMQKVLNEPPENPSMINLKLSPAVDRVLQRALAKKPQDRFRDAGAFGRELRLALEGATAGVTARGAPDASRKTPAQAEAVRGREDMAGGARSQAKQSGNVAGALLDAARLLNAGTNSTSGAQPSQTATAQQADAASNTGTAPPITDTTGGTISLDRSVRKARILFVDDEERILSALKSMFRDRYHVFTTTDCQKALDFVSKYAMHVVVSDQRMPEMLGVDFLRRSREVSPNTVRILLTGYSDLAAIVGSINDGEVYRFVSKPWDNTELRSTMSEAVTIGMELASAKEADSGMPVRTDAGVMVIDQNEDMYRVAKELVGKTCPVVFANSVDAALDKMQNTEIAVVVTDMDFAQDELSVMLKLLKLENPQILTIVATSASDSELVIEMINEAKVFRFLNKPVNVKLMRSHILSALKRSLAFRKAPVLAQVEAVKVADDVRESTLGQAVANRLSAAGRHWRARAAAAALKRRAAGQ